MGVPFFRSLNAGLECANKLIQMLTDSSAWLLGRKAALDLAIVRYSTFHGLISFREGAEATVKSGSIGVFASTLHAADHLGPLQIWSWSSSDLTACKSIRHPATLPPLVTTNTTTDSNTNTSTDCPVGPDGSDVANFSSVITSPPPPSCQTSSSFV